MRWRLDKVSEHVTWHYDINLLMFNVQSFRCYNADLHCLSFTDWWPIRTNQSNCWDYHTILHCKKWKELSKGTTLHFICIQQLTECCHQICPQQSQFQHEDQRLTCSYEYPHQQRIKETAQLSEKGSWRKHHLCKSNDKETSW